MEEDILFALVLMLFALSPFIVIAIKVLIILKEVV